MLYLVFHQVEICYILCSTRLDMLYFVFHQVEIMSDDEEEEEVITIPDDVYKPLSLEKMIALISLLVEKSRSAEDNQLQISDKDYNAIISGNKVSFQL